MGLTTQSAFNKSAKHLLKQNKKAIDTSMSLEEPTRCRYRAPDGAKCAIGALISNKEYRASMEGKNAAEIALHTLPGKFADVDPEVLGELQLCHDDLKPSRWGGRLRAIAKLYGLDPTAAQEDRNE